MDATKELIGEGAEGPVFGEKVKAKAHPEDSIIASVAEKAAYFDILRLWVNQTLLQQNAQQCFPYYLMAQSATPFGNSQNLNSRQTIAPNRAGDEVLGPNGGGYEYIIAPIWKRFVAETIDVAILFLIKLLVTFAIVDIFNVDLDSLLNLNPMKTGIEVDYTQLIDLASELIVLELLTKIWVCLYEMWWTMESHGGNMVGGATPGKLVMGIRILYVETVLIVDQPEQPVAGANAVNYRAKALLFPARNPGWKRAFARAFIKNATVIIPIVYPVYFITFMFRNNRMGYDVMTKTIVVEENQVPPLRRL